jgi:VanZ family protein
VPKWRSLIIYWLPVIGWMALIFSASSDRMSFEHSSRILAPILHFLFPHLSAEAVNAIVFYIRKCAHLTEYAILALLFWRALRKPVRKDRRPWEGGHARLAVMLVALYAASDEFHQSFVPSRQASVVDVMIDTIGGVVGILLLWGIGRWRKIW